MSKEQIITDMLNRGLIVFFSTVFVLGILIWSVKAYFDKEQKMRRFRGKEPWSI